MVKLKKYSILLFFIPGWLAAQEMKKLDLQQAYQLAEANYPVIKQKELVKQTSAINIENLQKGFLPQVSISGQATYQSDVTKIDVSLPGIDFNPPGKDQYKLVTDISQLIYDGGVTKEQKILQQLNASAEEQKLEVELYKIKERVNQIYLGALYLGEQLKQVDLVREDIRTGIKSMEAQVKNGVAFKSSLNMLKAELLKTDQRAIEIKSSQKGLIDALGVFIGRPLSSDLQLEKPVMAAVTSDEIVRPELKFYGEQSRLIAQQSKLITAKNLPRASLFVQGGYARPALNLLKNEFDFYYIGGIRFSWSLGGLYTKKKERELVEVNRKVNDIQKETFVLNTNTQLKQQQSEIDKLQQLVASDSEIINLRKTVTDAAKAQLENGVITASDFLKQVNEEDQARQAQITHQVQLLQAQINYQTISGKQ